MAELFALKVPPRELPAWKKVTAKSAASACQSWLSAASVVPSSKQLRGGLSRPPYVLLEVPQIAGPKRTTSKPDFAARSPLLRRGRGQVV